MSQPDPYQTFAETLTHVIGQALDAAAYHSEDNPTHQARGLFRYHKTIGKDQHGFIEFQTLYHPQSELSRFRVTLIRNSSTAPRTPTPDYAEHTLPYLIWHIYQARILPAQDYWWTYKYPNDLAPQLIQVGNLLFGYGVPWLEGY